MRALRDLVVLFSLTLLAACGDDDDGDTGSANNAGSTGTGDSRCERGCVATLAADCPNGPDTQQQCVADCEALESGDCGAEYAALQACAEGEAISCSAQGIPVVAACSAEQTVFIDCLN